MLKERLKQRLLRIPINHKALRENYKLSFDLEVDVKEIQCYLDELVNLEILKEKIQYYCPVCGDSEIMDYKTLCENLDEEGYLQCENCCSYIEPSTNKTGRVYYDIKNIEELKKW